MKQLSFAFIVFATLICVPGFSHALNIEDNGFAWKDASYKEKWEVCQILCGRLEEANAGKGKRKYPPALMYDCLQDTFSERSAGVLKEKIVTLGVWCYVLYVEAGVK